MGQVGLLVFVLFFHISAYSAAYNNSIILLTALKALYCKLLINTAHLESLKPSPSEVWL